MRTRSKKDQGFKVAVKYTTQRLDFALNVNVAQQVASILHLSRFATKLLIGYQAWTGSRNELLITVAHQEISIVHELRMIAGGIHVTLPVLRGKSITVWVR